MAIFPTPSRRDAAEFQAFPPLIPEIAGNAVAHGVTASVVQMDRAALDRISLTIIQSAIEIHRHLGPGLLENIYSACMAYELCERGLTIVTRQIIPVRYKKLVLDGAYRIDLVVEDAVIIELKSVEVLLPVHSAQLLSYLRLTEKSVGLLINFNVDYLVKGVKRLVNRF